MKGKIIYIILGVIALAAAAWWFLLKDKKTTDTITAVAVGKRADGTPYFEADVLAAMKRIKADPNWYGGIKESAAKDNIDLTALLRGNATWVLDREGA